MQTMCKAPRLNPLRRASEDEQEEWDREVNLRYEEALASNIVRSELPAPDAARICTHKGSCELRYRPNRGDPISPSNAHASCSTPRLDTQIPLDTAPRDNIRPSNIHSSLQHSAPTSDPPSDSASSSHQHTPVITSASQSNLAAVHADRIEPPPTNVELGKRCRSGSESSSGNVQEKPAPAKKSKNHESAAQKERRKQKKKEKQKGRPMSEGVKERRRIRKAWRKAERLGGAQTTLLSEKLVRKHCSNPIILDTDFDVYELPTIANAFGGKARPVRRDGSDDWDLDRVKREGKRIIVWDGCKSL